MAYAVLEFALAATAPLRSYRNTIITPWYWQLSFTLWGLYAGAGLILGALNGYLTTRLRSDEVEPEATRSRLEIAAAATLVLAFSTNLLTVAAIDSVALACSGILLAGLLAALVSRQWRDRTGILKNPWMTAGLLLLISRWSGDHRGSWVRAALPVLVPAIVPVGSAIGGRLHLAWPDKRANLFKAAVVLAAMVAVLGGTMYINPGLAPRQSSAPIPVRAGKNTPVVLISMDTVRADHLSVYGYARNTTPNLARFASSATLYRHAVAAADMTLPTHAAMFTGTYASWNGAHFNAPAPDPRPLSRAYRTLAELLAADGYLTISVAANFSYFQPAFGFERGFMVSDCPSPIQFLSYDRDYYLRFGVRKLFNRIVSTADFDLVTRRAAEINRAISQSLRRDWDGSQPVFLFANYMDAHCPYVPPRPFDRLFPGKSLRFTSFEYYRLAEDVAALKRTVTPVERAHLISQYDGSIAYLDSELGKLIARLKNAGLYDDALIIITSDHGEMFGEKNLVGHGISVYQDQIGIPLIIKYPHQQSASRIEEPVSQVDLLPTILDVLGYPVPAYVQGRSLLTVDGRPRPELVSESFAQPKFIEAHRRFNRIEWAFISGKMKLVSSTAGKRELYDIATDPGEQHDLCGSESGMCASLQQKLDDWKAGIPQAQMPVHKLDKQSMERLRSLGYVQ
jgi:arylsulfatase A-like enzyme